MYIPLVIIGQLPMLRDMTGKGNGMFMVSPDHSSPQSWKGPRSLKNTGTWQNQVLSAWVWEAVL